MCGIVGLTAKSNSPLHKRYEKVLRELFLLSETRGKEASGIALHGQDTIEYMKTPNPVAQLVKSKIYKNSIQNFLSQKREFYSSFGHSRLVTNGYEHFSYNNQPVIKEGMTLVHNGIIVNSDKLSESYGNQKETDLDTEFIPILLNKYLKKGEGLKFALRGLYKEIKGMTTFALFSKKYYNLILATNNGSAYYMKSRKNDAFIFGSERYILETLIDNLKLEHLFEKNSIRQLKANSSGLLNLSSLEFEVSDFTKDDSEFSVIEEIVNDSVKVKEIYLEEALKPKLINTSLDHSVAAIPKEFKELYNKRVDEISKIKRCKKCILPETFPFIQYDDMGICNFCKNHKKLEYKGADAFRKVMEEYKSKNGKPNCLMPFSGGRDSSFALHYIKKELGMNPIAYSYDWGMLTDLGRRNQSKMCGELGVEHILVSSDIRKKRKNIKKNVSAWLKRPNLGTIPLFMAGDKQYFYFSNQLMKQNNLKVSIMGENMLEVTRFKTGFCGVPPYFDAEQNYHIPVSGKLKMLYFYGKEFLFNPAYINSSIWDTLDAFKSYYVIEHKTLNIFDYLPWDETIIEDVLINQYGWETDPGTSTTWRIGDGTAAFYNYIYYIIAGFTEFDTFRSNQIREGMLDRETALKKTQDENQPRWDSIQWYCKTIGIDWKEAIKKINKVKTRY